MNPTRREARPALILPRHVVEELSAPRIPGGPKPINLNETPFRDFTFTTTRLRNVIQFLTTMADEGGCLVRVEKRETAGKLLGDWHIDYRYIHEIEAEYEEWT